MTQAQAHHVSAEDEAHARILEVCIALQAVRCLSETCDTQAKQQFLTLVEDMETYLRELDQTR